MSRPCLVLFPHGSRDPQWRTYFEGLESDLQHRHGTDRVRLAYQQFVPPTLRDTASAAQADGIDHLQLLPLFMSVSRATIEDIERQAREARQALPNLRIDILPPASDSPDFREAIMALANAAVNGESAGLTPAPSKRPGVGIGVIIMRKGRVLLGRRRNAHGEGSWSCPGGHLEFGETIEECARRETLEETGLAIGQVRHAAFTNDIFADHGKQYVTLFVIADRLSDEPRNMEPEFCDGWKWFSWDRLPEPLFPPVQSLLDQKYRPPGL